LRHNLYIGNLASTPSTGDRELRHLLSRFGVVRYAAVVAGGFGVVEMQTEPDAEAAIKGLNGSEFHGRLLTVRWATPPEQTACGHPAMFGTMNVPNGDQRDAGPAAEHSGNSATRTATDEG
jgi:RNA recognition motif-containing protein